MLGHTRRELGWMAVAAGSAAITGAVVGKAMTTGWRAITDEEPPEVKALAREPWKKALTWAVVTAGVAAAAEVLAQKGAAAGWRKATGRKPPRV